MATSAAPGASPILRSTGSLGFPWPTVDPFLFCVHHLDDYPAGDARMAPAASLAGRRLGNDFELRDGFRMYHGRTVPGFPQHPHRGFETVTIVRQGFIDHSDSLGATARFGAGDVQWMTAGRGIVHAEMFPLRRADGPNPAELFQLWLNLPARSKMVEPYFRMMWAETIPEIESRDAAGRRTRARIIAGKLGDARAPAPPPDSWASDARSELAIWTLALEPGAQFTLPAAAPGASRTLYFFAGATLTVGGAALASHQGVSLRPDVEVRLEAGATAVEALLLQGRPIGEPVAHMGPFVMNTRDELVEAFEDYRQTGFGGWPWPSDDPVHPRERGRFARHADGRVEEGGGRAPSPST